MSGPPASLFQAEQALARGDAANALLLLNGRTEPAAVHLRAMALRRTGRLEEARAAFEQATDLAPGDRHLANNHANLLGQLGRFEEALALYDRALSLGPGYRDAAFNKALLLQRMERHAEALALLQALCDAAPADARAHSARGGVLRDMFRHEDAAVAYDRALALQANDPKALKGRAQVALEQGETDAPAFFQRAIVADPTDLGTLHGYAEALVLEGGADVPHLLEEVLAARPDWLDGHKLLMRVKAEAGDPDFANAMKAAAARRPDDPSMWMALAQALAGAERWDEALTALPPIESPNVRTMRAHYLAEGGDPEAALALLGSENRSEAGQLIAARALLRLRESKRAVAELEHAVTANPRSIAAWG